VCCFCFFLAIFFLAIGSAVSSPNGGTHRQKKTQRQQKTKITTQNEQGRFEVAKKKAGSAARGSPHGSI
jgi:hypothetical protein